MTKRPTPPPLTGTERAALYDLVTRAARGLPTEGDGKRLLRLRELDHADRIQERRSAGGVQKQLRQRLKDTEEQLAAAQAVIARVRKLHRALELIDSWVCLGCGEPWPCQTEDALQGP